MVGNLALLFHRKNIMFDTDLNAYVLEELCEEFVPEYFEELDFE
jgi:hypothetical protein